MQPVDNFEETSTTEHELHRSPRLLALSSD
jgi:hypothetical protein